MADTEIDLHPVDRITADALGIPGKRVFYLQGQKEDQVVTLILEKSQVQALAIGVEEFLAELAQRFPDLPKADDQYQEEAMRITPPVDPLFRIGELHLGYHMESDFVVLIAKGITPEEASPAESSNLEKAPEESQVVRFWCTRTQLRRMASWGLEVVSHGRSTCPLCGEPISPQEPHVCIKKNGKKHSPLTIE